MTADTDTELAAWQHDWSASTEPLPDYARTIRRQNRRLVVSTVLVGVATAIASTVAIVTRRSFLIGLATGLWLTALVVGGYSWWSRRGAWTPAAETTRAYVTLLHARAIAQVRTLTLACGLLLAAATPLAGLVVWNGGAITKTTAVIFAALGLEVIILWRKRRRAVREVDRTSALIDAIDA